MSVIKEAFKEVLGQDREFAFVNNYINGRFTWVAQSKASEVKNPATEETIAFVHDAPKELIAQSCYAARQSQPYWHFEVDMQEKEAIFRLVANYLNTYRGELAWVIIKEGGKLWKWAEAEVQETIDTLWHYHGEISRVEGRFSRCQMRDKASITIRDPYGVILGITPWNFPMAVPSWKIFAALASGNSIIIKDAEQTPITVSLLAYLFHHAVKMVLGETRAKKLGGVFQVVHGRGETTGKILLEEGDYDKVMFTGGTETGALVAGIAGQRNKPCSRELGGHAAIILLDDFDLDRAVKEAVTACNGDTGQRCVSLREVYVHQNVAAKFTSKYIEQAIALKIGNPANPATEVGPLISQEQLNRVWEGVLQSVGGNLNCPNLLIGGRPVKDARFYSLPNVALSSIGFETREKGYYFLPTVLTDMPADSYVRTHEIFGPVLCITPVFGNSREQVFENALAMMNRSRYGLSNAVMTNDITLAMRAIERVKTGILYINRGTTGAEVGQPFGGVKESGDGREGRGTHETTVEKQVWIDYASGPRMAQSGGEDAVKQLLSNSRQTVEKFLK